MNLSVSDRLALSGLVQRYAGCVDARRFAELTELFTADAELVLPDPPRRLEPCVRHRGHAGIGEAMSALAAVARTHHGIHGEIYTTADDGQATGEITGVAHHWVDDDGRLTDHVWYLRYRDTYRRDQHGWRIASRALTIDAIESRPARQVRT